MEKATMLQGYAIKQLHRTSDSHVAQLVEMHRHIEGLDNWGRRHNIRVCGVPESVEPQANQRSQPFSMIS